MSAIDKQFHCLVAPLGPIHGTPVGNYWSREKNLQISNDLSLDLIECIECDQNSLKRYLNLWLSALYWS